MKNIKILSTLTVASFVLLGVFLFAKPAKAADSSPAPLKVATSFTPYNGPTETLTGVKFSVLTVGVPNLIPVPRCNYGNATNAYYHLDYNKNVGNGCGNVGTYPETNRIDGLLTSTTGGSFFGAPYSFNLLDALIWCGSSAGVPEGTFKVEVRMNPDFNKNTIQIGNRTITGKWNVVAQEIGGQNRQEIAYDTNSVQAVAYNPNTTLVYFNFYEDPPPPPESTGYLGCAKDSTDGQYYWVGQAVDGTAQAQSPIMYVANTDTLQIEQDNITANVQGTVYANRTTLYKAYPYVNSATNYQFKVPIDKKFFTGNNINLRAVLKLRNKAAGASDYRLPNNGIYPQPFSIGNSSSSSCTDMPTYSFPWLQTRQGDVISSNGKLLGQYVGLPGSRSVNNPQKDAEYLVMAYIGGSYPFCSDYAYILSNDNAVSDNTVSCSNGQGYKPTYDSLGAGNEDKIIKSAKANYQSLGANCAQEKADGSVPTSVEITTCPAGAIYKLTSSTLANSASYTLAKGNITIYREGDLTINNNLDYATTPYSNLNLNNLRDVPNLTIIVNGNVKIASVVSQLKATIYATGYINTCSTFISDTSALCTSQLNVKGTLSAKNGFIFARANPGSTNPAEKITLYPRALVYPSPVLDKTIIQQGNSSVRLDYAEYQPRF